jgi:hypothetical protein
VRNLCLHRSNHDPEHVWDQALEHALGPQEWSEHYATDPEFPKTWTDAEIDRMAMVGMAFGAIAKIGIAAAHDLVRQDQLFGPAAKMPDASTPEWMAACRMASENDDAVVRGRTVTDERELE